MTDHDEWRREVASMTEWDRDITRSEVRRSQGLSAFGPEDFQEGDL